ncbi:MAG: hypothetical protein U5L45_11275 [Saprospiraceae bacterium]|nr:hypothetical protein [Saprospiraceae bacterium]
MKLPILILFFLLRFLNTTLAQLTPIEGFTDCVLLKNGSKIYGKILYYAPNDTLEFQILGGRAIRYAPETVEKVVMAQPKSAQSAKETTLPRLYEFRERGVYGSVLYNMSFGRDKNGGGTHTGVGLQATAGYLFRRDIGFGGGLGYDGYYLKGGNANVWSGFGEIRGYLSKRNFSEFFTLAVGYGQPMKTDNAAISTRKGGLMLQPTIGLRLGASARYNFFVDFGARFQQVHYDFSNEWIENKYKVTYQRWILRGGILF